jgi:hypothetical protein
VNEFVEECRAEWERLGVPSPVIDDMAGELATDIEEAEAEGASAEDVLGAGAHPREFATAWAAERGVIERSLPGARGSAWRSLTSAVIAALAVIAIAGAVLVIFVSPAGSDKSALPLPHVVPDGGTVWTVDGTASPLPVIVQDLGSGVRTVEIGPSDSSDSSDTRAAGSVMLFAALAGIVLLTMWAWAGPGRSPLRRRRINGRSSGQA